MKNLTIEQQKKRIRQSWPYGGDYKGYDIDFIPSSYLKWVAENFSEKTLFGKLCCMVADEEWQYRENHNCHIDNENTYGDYYDFNK